MLRFFLDSMYLPVVMLGDLDGFERFFVLIFSWQHCYGGYREVWGGRGHEWIAGAPCGSP